jgi:hypothetical protein
MRIQITPDGYICQDSEAPIVGRSYYLEDATSGTTAQNKAFHALVAEYYKSGCHSHDSVTYMMFREIIKRDLGAGFEKVMYSESPLHIVKSFQEVPIEIRRLEKWKSHILGKLKSWSEYTLKERRNTMDLLIAEMHQVGVTTKKFYQILEGMEK